MSTIQYPVQVDLMSRCFDVFLQLSLMLALVYLLIVLTSACTTERSYFHQLPNDGANHGDDCADIHHRDICFSNSQQWYSQPPRS
jgi:hypothetical protein